MSRLFFALVFGLPGLLPGPASALQFAQTTVEYTATPEEDEFTAEFAFTNETGRKVTVVSVESNCGCLRAETDKKAYEPGETGKLEAAFTIGSFEGTQTKTVQVVTDEPADTDGSGMRSYELRVKLTVPTLVEIEPKLAVWQQGDLPEPRTLKIKMLGEDPIRITAIQSTRPNFKVEWKAVEEGRIYEVTLTPDSVAQAQLGMLTIQTDCSIPRHQRKLAFFSVQKRKETRE